MKIFFSIFTLVAIVGAGRVREPTYVAESILNRFTDVYMKLCETLEDETKCDKSLKFSKSKKKLNKLTVNLEKTFAKLVKKMVKRAKKKTKKEVQIQPIELVEDEHFNHNPDETILQKFVEAIGF